eukprot:jgi/Hompol1/6147/HPOL_002652-RA
MSPVHGQFSDALQISGFPVPQSLHSHTGSSPRPASAASAISSPVDLLERFLSGWQHQLHKTLDATRSLSLGTHTHISERRFDEREDARRRLNSPDFSDNDDQPSASGCLQWIAPEVSSTPSTQTEQDKGSTPVTSPNKKASKRRTGTRTYPCKICPKVFYHRHNLASHMVVHSTERPHKCDSCPVSFARAHDLTRHKKCHTRPAIICLACSRPFARKDALSRHIKLSISCRSGDGDLPMDEQ